jgi:hypothetical protein
MSLLTCFMMMQFDGEHQAEIFQKVEESVNRVNALGEYKVKLIRADLSKPLSISSIEDHLKEYIVKCDFAIAEITQLNPNVMFEMGYAIGVNKPVIVMVQRGIQLPADFRGRLYFQYSMEELELIPQLLKGYIQSAIEAGIAGKQKLTYNIRCFSNRAFSDILDETKNANEHFEILTTNLESFISSGMANIVKTRVKHTENFKVRILTLDPESDFAAHRARQLKKSTRHFREVLRAALEKTSQLFFDCPNNVNIATFDEFPPQISYRIDDTIYISIVSSHRVSRENIILRFHEANANAKESVVNHFDTVWGRSQPFHRIHPDEGCVDK